MSPLEAAHIQRALRKTAQLRNLTLSLRWAKEAAARERLLAEFDSFLQRLETMNAGSHDSPLPSAAALLVGVRACWARGDYATISRVAALLPKDLLDRHLLLRAFVTEASEAAEKQSTRQSRDSGPDQKVGMQ